MDEARPSARTIGLALVVIGLLVVGVFVLAGGQNEQILHTMSHAV